MHVLNKQLSILQGVSKKILFIRTDFSILFFLIKIMFLFNTTALHESYLSYLIFHRCVDLSVIDFKEFLIIIQIYILSNNYHFLKPLYPDICIKNKQNFS